VRLFDLLPLWEPGFTAIQAKIHLGRYNGNERPIDEFLAGRWDEWQRWQTGPNFERPYVVSLVQDGLPTRWLFAGLFRSHGAQERPGARKPLLYYDLERLASADEWVGRLYLTSPYKSRWSYLKGETIAHNLVISELLPEPRSIGQFPGYKHLDLPKAQLDLVVRQNLESWRAALASVKGIYLISDTAKGKLYVGKADGADGIWGRWCAYAATGHGGNKALRDEFGLDGSEERLAALRFSILEIADLHATRDEVLAREAHWKTVLLSKQHGHNRN
jgi:hypothetical protein